MSDSRRRLEAIAIFAGSFALAALVVKNRPFVEHLVGSLGFFAYPLAVLLFAVVASAPFSVTDALAIMNGVLFGPLWGSILNAAGLVLAAIAGYYLAFRTARLLDLESHIERLPPWVRRFRIASPAFLLAVRIIPGFGGTVATNVAATFRVPLFVHVWTMCAIAIPICTLLAIFGDRVAAFVHEQGVHVRTYYEHHHPHFRRQNRVELQPRR